MILVILYMYYDTSQYNLRKKKTYSTKQYPSWSLRCDSLMDTF